MPTLHIRGAQAHEAYAHRGDNPAHRLARIIAALAQDASAPPFQVTRLQSGVGAGNVTPPSASAQLLADAENADKLRGAVQALCQQYAPDRWRFDAEGMQNPEAVHEPPQQYAAAPHPSSTPAAACQCP